MKFLLLIPFLALTQCPKPETVEAPEAYSSKNSDVVFEDSKSGLSSKSSKDGIAEVPNLNDNLMNRLNFPPDFIPTSVPPIIDPPAVTEVDFPLH